MVRTKLAVALALVGAALSPIAHALGLGPIEVRSALNQPLDARVPLLPAEPGEIETLSLSLASAEAFYRAGIDRPFSLTRLKFKVVPGDEPFVRIYTEQPVKEPFLDFLLQADWARGRLVREFTVLLDPPVYGGPQVAAPAVIASTPARSMPTPVVGAEASAAVATAAAAVPSTQVAALPEGAPPPVRYGPVAANDTLWKIANAVRPDASVSVHQTMVALLRANPAAFIDGDMNRLRRGAVLQVPDVATVAAVNAAQAGREVREHIQRWRQANRETTRGRLQVLAPANDRNSEEAGDESPSELPAAEQAAVERLEQELKLHRESTVNLEAENEELKAQVAALKQELSHLEHLIKLQVQQPVAAPAADAEPKAPEASAAAAEDAAAAPQQPPAQPTAVEQPAAEKAPPKPAPAPAVPQRSKPSFLDDPRNLGLLGGVGLGLLGLVFMAIRRRRQAAESVSLESMPATDPEPEPGAEQKQAAGQSVEQHQPDQPEPAADPLGDLPPDGDVLGEVDIYLAYGRHDQAREVIAKALRGEPDRVDLQLKQLEILAQIPDADGFAVAAGVLHGLVDESDSAWQRALELGRELLPSHPLFSDVQEAAVATVADTGDFAAEQSADLGVDLEADLEADLDFDSFAIDEPSPTAAAPAAETAVASAAAPADDFSLDFELPALDPEPAAATTSTAAAAQPEADTFELDMADLPELAEMTEPAPGPATDEGLDFELDDLAFDDAAGGVSAAAADNVVEFAQPARTDDDQSAQLDDLDEAGVKLDLARAYLEMGDSEGARSLLDEVLAEGSQRQRQEAEGLLAQIA